VTDLLIQAGEEVVKYFELENVEDGKICVVTISRPEVLNALNGALILEGMELFESLLEKKDLRVLILRGAGEKSFVAGADIQALSEANEEEGKRVSELGQKFFSQIETFPSPVIAAINGFALGGGLELAMACDLRYASSKAKLGLPEVTLGLIPGYGGTCRLPRLIGMGRALEYIMTGEMVSATTAREHGLVQDVFEPEHLMDEVMKKANLLASRAPLALQSSKRSVKLGMSLDLASALMGEQSEFAQICSTEDMKEGTRAFLEKRPARFEGK